MSVDQFWFVAPGFARIFGTHRDEITVRISVADAFAKRSTVRRPSKSDQQFAIRTTHNRRKGRVKARIFVNGDVVNNAY